MRLLANPVWHALRTKHRHLAVGAGAACRYPAEVAPFAAVAEPGAFAELSALLEPGELVWVVAETVPSLPEIAVAGTLKCLQMVLPESVPAAAESDEIVRLGEANAAEMLALTDIAFPGFFRRRTCAMGAYYGVRSESGELIAMGGERLMLPGYPEISGVCTHPAHRGRGLAASLIWRLVREHRREGLVSWLHVGSENRRAIELYLRLGFRIAQEITLQQVTL